MKQQSLYNSIMVEERTKFGTHCPYCRSEQLIKAGHRLKFKNIYFEEDDPYYVRKYPKVPIWKCKVCKNWFALDLSTSSAWRLEDFSSSDNSYSIITRENFLFGD